MHAGHIALLSAARAECDRLIVALNTDPGTPPQGTGAPGQRPRRPAAVISAVEAVDAVISFDEETPIE